MLSVLNGISYLIHILHIWGKPSPFVYTHFILNWIFIIFMFSVNSFTLFTSSSITTRSILTPNVLQLFLNRFHVCSTLLCSYSTYSTFICMIIPQYVHILHSLSFIFPSSTLIFLSIILTRITFLYQCFLSQRESFPLFLWFSFLLILLQCVLSICLFLVVTITTWFLYLQLLV